ncbi:uncharacterized protein LOC115926069 [Strongylocentrotus purpuratus]|uniref:Uncharacterized protein n=1 Tax=Strongylocentrotus purpuratus TaxID=7668 RepID=A0A7M7T160_STRPU|nr:uncharacterized protein LOC115926069 [Strongylocentrotus purpuratus]
MANLPQDEEVQPAYDLERNGLQREEHVAKAGRYYSLDQREKVKFEALLKGYLKPSGIGSEVFLKNLICFSRYETRCPPPRRYVQESTLLVKEVCIFMADPFMSYMQKHFVHVPLSLSLLLGAGRGGRMTVPEFQRDLQRIHSGMFPVLHALAD